MELRRLLEENAAQPTLAVDAAKSKPEFDFSDVGIEYDDDPE
jgi:hypothetical protein